MIRKALFVVIVFAVTGLGAGLWITRPDQVDQNDYFGLVADPVRGEYVFRAAGCASCHAARDAGDAERLKLGGGQEFASPFGTFLAPNISPDKTYGIGDWTAIDLANALTRGTGRDGQHLYPALPYASYVNMAPSDVVSLHAYLMTLPPVAEPSKPHQVGFPFNIRATLGGWKLLFFRKGWTVDPVPPEAETGRYIAEALAHCSECHTARNALGGLKRGQWLGGAPNPTGKGTIPDIRPSRLTWSPADVVTYLQSGFTPEFDTAGGQMVEVIQGLSGLPEADLASLAAYLDAVPAAR